MFIGTGRRANIPEKIFGVGAGLGSVWLTRGSASAPRRSTKLSRKSSYIGYDNMLPPELLPKWLRAPLKRTSCSGALTGSIRSNTSSTRVKIAVLAPMPSAIEITATAVNNGERVRPRQA